MVDRVNEHMFSFTIRKEQAEKNDIFFEIDQESLMPEGFQIVTSELTKH